jgi:protein gp37
MGAETKIEWCDHTFNPWIGCTKVSPGCAHCYAEGKSKRRGWAQWGKGKERHHTSENYWKQPLKWNRAAYATNLNGFPRPRVFCASLADVFDPEVPDEWRCALFDTITETPNLDWLILTKRPEIAHDFYHNKIGLQDETIRDKFLPNVWLGVSVEDQKRADERIPILLLIPAKVRFLSCEPLLGPVDISRFLQCSFTGIHTGCSQVDWVIVGGESGHHARPMHPDWARSVRDQCIAAGAAFLFKQWGEFHPSDFSRWPTAPEFLVHRESGRSFPFTQNGSKAAKGLEDFYAMQRVGKKRAGRLLDGREWNEFPTVHSAVATT